MKYIVFDIETTGLNPAYDSRVTCICAKDNDGNKFNESLPDEETIITNFFDWLGSYDQTEYTLISKNGKKFDIPFLLLRLAKINPDLTKYMFITNYNHFDLQDITTRWVSLEDMTKILGLDGKNGNGKNAIRLWEDGEIEKLVGYCGNDVDVTEKVYLKFVELGE